MLVLRLTSGSDVIGVVTDDGFVIGRVTFSGSLKLAVGYTVFGVVLGLLYALARRFLPRRGRIAAWAGVTGAIGGGSFCHSSSIDYLVLDPLWLAIVFFVALPALAGLCVAWLVERIEARGSASAAGISSVASRRWCSWCRRSSAACCSCSGARRRCAAWPTRGRCACWRC